MAAELFAIDAHEVTALDTSRIVLLRQSLGDQRCREIVEEVVFHLTDRLRLLEAALGSGDIAEVLALSTRLAGLSEQLGLADFARVARNLHHCADSKDPIATAAVGARLIRLGEESLFSVMVYADQTAL